MQTGENEHGLRTVLDMTRMISLVILGLHFYYYCYGAFAQWHLRASISDCIMANISHTGLFSNPYKSKLIALGFLAISLLGSKGRKNEKQDFKSAFAYIISGLLVYFISNLILLLHGRM
ncbi:MAG: YWFCY domain-containing protein, partial [Bacteroidetes bacterium]|nr:YWFCY domain-containing protein [Bacteroidota bacterium]